MLSGNGRLGPDVEEPRGRFGRPIAALLSDLAGETSTLVRQEIALFKAELTQAMDAHDLRTTKLYWVLVSSMRPLKTV